MHHAMTHCGQFIEQAVRFEHFNQFGQSFGVTAITQLIDFFLIIFNLDERA